MRSTILLQKFSEKLTFLTPWYTQFLTSLEYLHKKRKQSLQKNLVGNTMLERHKKDTRSMGWFYSKLMNQN